MDQLKSNVLTLWLRNSVSDTFHHRDHDSGSQERSPRSLDIEPPRSPFTPTADPDGMLLETCESPALDYASDDCLELSVSSAINEHNEEVISEYPPWEHENEQEKEHTGNKNARGRDNLEICPVDLQCSWHGVHSETSQDVLKPPSPCAASQATREVFEVLEQGDERSPLERRVGFRASTSEPYFPKPCIVVSNTVSDSFSVEKLLQFCESSSNIESSIDEIEMGRDASQQLHKSVPSFRRRTSPGGLGGYSPNNYEIATQDRQSPRIPGGIDRQTEKIAAARLNEFCIDADTTAGDPAASPCANMGPSLIKRRRASGNQPAFLTLGKHPSSQQHWQGSPSNPPNTSAVQNHLQVPTYPTPPLSSRQLPSSQHLDSAYVRYNTPTPSYNSPIESYSPISPSPSSLPEAPHDFISCQHCPQTRFTGPNQKNSLQRHIRDKHGDMPRLPCLIQECNVTFAPGRKDNQLKHVRATHPDYSLPDRSTKRKRKADSR